MLRPTTSRWLKRIGLAGVAAASLAAVTLPTAPAQAQVVVGFGSPYYAPSFGYPYGYGYGYGYPGVVFGFGGGWHHHHHHHW
jgi:hypothetical protein